MANDDKEDDDNDTDPSQSLLTSQEPLQLVQSLQAFFPSLSSTNDDHFRALDSMQTFVDRTISSAWKGSVLRNFRSGSGSVLRKFCSGSGSVLGKFRSDSGSVLRKCRSGSVLGKFRSGSGSVLGKFRSGSRTSHNIDLPFA
ncbi:hypothetical protein AVEN_262322-1 [Araneus ventricosus]|uniref:Uncharacterized protein n=1 Tax=Araneus ventricosus TaxID=182803 RepID=A0A4Y2RNQ4_ARAVE|nr:hypothetical protein AVEN_262322-1 [Araneus ventricosus]